MIAEMRPVMTTKTAASDACGGARSARQRCPPYGKLLLAPLKPDDSPTTHQPGACGWSHLRWRAKIESRKDWVRCLGTGDG